MEMEREEGEMSDDNDNAMLVDDCDDLEKSTEIKRTTLYKADKNGVIIKELEKIDATKLEERAKRFGLDLSGNKVVTQKQIDELYANCGIESGNERHFRFDSIHLYGVDGLTTREIFEYLADYKPVSLEWIDNNSCNIVCQDHISAALALLVHSREIVREDLKEMIAKKSHHHWRQGIPHPKKELIIMRFATNGDRKMTRKNNQSSNEFFDYNTESVSKNPWGDLCKSWGVYDHQEIFNRKLSDDDVVEQKDEPHHTVHIKNKKMAMRLGKRLNNYEKNDDSDSDSEWRKKSKMPRMRMHADDEDLKHKKNISHDSDRELSNEKDIYAPLSIEVVNLQNNYLPKETKLSDKFKTLPKGNVPQKLSVQSRLGSKVIIAKGDISNDDSSNDSVDHNVLSRVQKVSRENVSSYSSVWSRLETDDKDTHMSANLKGGQSDLRHILKSKRQKNTDDLRVKISKIKQTNLRIEIDNNYARS